MLFGKGYALQTVLLWVIFFCSLMNLFLFVYWLPEVLHLTGMTPPEAARATSFRELGAIAAVLYLGVLIDRFGPERALAATMPPASCSSPRSRSSRCPICCWWS